MMHTLLIIPYVLVLLSASCAWETVVCQQTWAQMLEDQVLGPLYVLEDGANTSQLVAGLTLDPFAQAGESVPAAVLVAKGEQPVYAHQGTCDR